MARRSDPLNPGARRATRRPGQLHPGAWWVWAALLAIAAVRTTNPLLLLTLGSVVAFVVGARRTDAPWSRSFGAFLRIGFVVLAIRLVVQLGFGLRLPGHVLFRLPRAALPSWAAGVSIGGPVTIESVLQATYEGLRLGVILVCFGAANALASPHRLLRCLPSVLYETGVAVTVALAFAPEAVMGAAAIREARRLRGRPTRGFAGVRGLAVPVLQAALDRSIQLAASMDSRGYGRRTAVSVGGRRLSLAATTTGLLLLSVGVYGVLDAGAPTVLGPPALGAGAALTAAGLVASGRRTVRSRYRPDPWGTPEWAAVVGGVVAVAGFMLTDGRAGGPLHPSVFPLSVPGLPVGAFGAAFAGLLPAARLGERAHAAGRQHGDASPSRSDEEASAVTGARQ